MEAKRYLPRYKCHKEVSALAIKEVEIRSDGAVIITPEDYGFDCFSPMQGWLGRFDPKGGDLGYFVVYEGGYQSWSPSAAFENGYTRM